MFCLSLNQPGSYRSLMLHVWHPVKQHQSLMFSPKAQKRGCCQYAMCLPFHLYYKNSCDFPISSSKQENKPNSSQRLFAEDLALQEEKQERKHHVSQFLRMTVSNKDNNKYKRLILSISIVLCCLKAPVKHEELYGQGATTSLKSMRVCGATVMPTDQKWDL